MANPQKPLSELEAKLPRIGEVISNDTLSKEIFVCANMGGMRYTRTYRVLVLISNHVMKMSNPVFNPYDDKWINGVLYYTGEGNIGDQPNPPTRQNKRLANQDYKACYLFEVFRQGEYTYKGRVDLAGNPMYGSKHPRGIQPDRNGKMRNVWIFPITRQSNGI